MKVDVMLSSSRFLDESVTARRPVATDLETCERRMQSVTAQARQGTATTNMNRKLPRVHEGLPVRNAQVEVVDERHDRDTGLELGEEGR